MTKWKFKLLPEEVSDNDLIEDTPHERIASTLYETICDNSTGLSIGLEGNYGAGKSTIINLLRSKFSTNGKYNCFYFDAWSHEGDPLRRIFLESLIDEFGEGSTDLEQKRAVIANLTKTVTKTVEKTVTPLATLVAIFSLFVPFGLAWFGNLDLEQVTWWDISADFHWSLLGSVLLSLAPLGVIIYHSITLVRRNKEIFEAKNWSFLANRDTSTTEREVSDSPERTSVEFEKYFGEIISYVIESRNLNGIVIILDNLDRVDVADSLKLFSTLQTFIQHRNNVARKHTEWHKRIWTVIPYDQQGLKNLWDKAENNNSLSFIEKSFQLRVVVPPMIISTWESFMSSLMKESLGEWPDRDYEAVREIFKASINELGESPRPRTIKTYLNQVALVRTLAHSEIDTTSIAYYVIHKFIHGMDDKALINGLIHYEFPKQEDLSFLDEDVRIQIAAIIFQTSKEQGIQLLLESHIGECIRDRKDDDLLKLEKVYGTSFWTVFTLHIKRQSNFGYLLNMAHFIRTTFEDRKKHLSIYKNKLEQFDRYEVEHYMPKDVDSVNNYISVFKVIGIAKCRELWSQLLKELVFAGNKSSQLELLETYQIHVSAIWEIIRPKFKNFPTMDANWDIQMWFSWAENTFKREDRCYEYIKPHRDVNEKVANAIRSSIVLSEEIYFLNKYLLKTGNSEWKGIAEALNDRVNSLTINTVPIIQKNFTRILFQILFDVGFAVDINDEAFKKLLQLEKLHSVFKYLNDPQIIRMMTLLKLRFFSANSRVGGVANAMDAVINKYLGTSSKEEGNELWRLCVEKNDYQLLDQLILIKRHNLIDDVVIAALNQKNGSEFFNSGDVLRKFIFCHKLMLDRKIEEEHLDTFEIDSLLPSITPEVVGSNLEAFHFLFSNNWTDEYLPIISNVIYSAEQNVWIEAFIEDTYLIPILLLYKEKSQVSLGENYYLGVEELYRRWLSNDSFSPSKWQSENLQELVGVLDKSHYGELMAFISRVIQSNNLKVSQSVIAANNAFIDRAFAGNLLRNIGDELGSTIKKAFEDKDFQWLASILFFLKLSDKRMFKASESIKDVIAVPFEVIMKETTDKEHIKVLKSFASFLEIKFDH